MPAIPSLKAFLAVLVSLAAAPHASAEEADAQMEVIRLRQQLGKDCRRQDSAAIAATLEAGERLGSKYGFLWPGEKVLSRLLARRFDVLDSADLFHTRDTAVEYDPPDDELYDSLVSEADRRFGEFTSREVRARLGDERADFLEILVRWYLGDRRKEGTEHLARLCRGFRKAYPKSIYLAFIEDTMEHRPRSESPAFAGFGLAYGRFLGGTGEKLSDTWLLALDIGMVRRRHHFQMGLGAGFVRTGDGLRGEHRLLKPDDYYLVDQADFRYGYSTSGERTAWVPYAGYSLRTFLNTDDPWLFAFLAGVQLWQFDVGTKGGFTYWSLDIGGAFQYGDFFLRERFQGPALSAKVTMGAGS